MKKLINKIRKRKDDPPPSRITSDTVAQHRERILAGGRKFKYPIQYARHKLVFNAISITFVAIVIASIFTWWQLYPQQNTSEFIYRITKVIPVPVAVVDGQQVLYSDYLMKYLSSVRYLERKEQLSTKTDDGKRQVEYIKQKSMQYVIANAYASKLAPGLNVSVGSGELNDFLKHLRQTSSGEISDQTNNSVILDYYGWTPAEYRYIIEKELLRQKVSYAMDKSAQDFINDISASLKKNSKTDFKTIVSALSKLSKVKVSYGASGWVPKTNQDGGLASEAVKLAKLGVSPVIQSTQGDEYFYYVIRLRDVSEKQVSYDYIRVQLTAFSDALQKAKKDGKISEFISIKR